VQQLHHAAWHLCSFRFDPSFRPNQKWRNAVVRFVSIKATLQILKSITCISQVYLWTPILDRLQPQFLTKPVEFLYHLVQKLWPFQRVLKRTNESTETAATKTTRTAPQ
jgi:hypothetical protein